MRKPLSDFIDLQRGSQGAAIVWNGLSNDIRKGTGGDIEKDTTRR